jgi:hypothetical protein
MNLVLQIPCYHTEGYSYWVHMSQVVSDFMAINETFKKLPIGTEDSHQVYW